MTMALDADTPKFDYETTATADHRGQALPAGREFFAEARLRTSAGSFRRRAR
jgi:hypothetical protein